MADGANIAVTQGLRKFSDPEVTASGAARAEAPFRALKTLWINTGTLCNIACANCYIESSPTNDRLVYMSAAEAAPFIDEACEMGAEEIAFTGGEPFMNPDLFEMVERALARGARVLILTNAMQPMMRPKIRVRLQQLIEAWEARVAIRVSFDHFTEDGHDRERGGGAFSVALGGLAWLSEIGAALSVAGRAALSEREDVARAGYRAFFTENGVQLDADDPGDLILFPEMEHAADPPEITTECWRILDRRPEELMCASSRMLVKRRGAAAPTVLACTLIPYNDEFDMGGSLTAAARPVKLNHPHCATFCVLGGSSCSA